MLVGERPYLGATHDKTPNGLIPSQEGDAEGGCLTLLEGNVAAQRELVASSGEVMHMDWLSINDSPSSNKISSDWSP